MSGLKLVTFDLDDTLWDIRPTIVKAERKMRHWLSQHVPNTDHWLRPDVLAGIRDNLLVERPQLQHDLGQLRRLVTEIAIVRSGVGKPEAKKISSSAFDVFLDARHDVVYFEGALEALDVLSSHFVLGALSNGNADITRLGLDRYFSFAHTAASIGLGKPHPDMFQQALKSANVAPEEALHIGDRTDHDVTGAAMVGMHTLHYKNILSPVMDGDIQPTLVADNMQDLQKKVLAFARQLAD